MLAGVVGNWGLLERTLAVYEKSAPEEVSLPPARRSGRPILDPGRVITPAAYFWVRDA
jgi:hypothetical protein